MQKTRLQKLLSLIVCIVLIAAMALVTTGCKDDKKTSEKNNSESISSQEDKETSKKDEITVVGEGETIFNFSVTDADGKEMIFEIQTDKKTVGEALLDEGLIEGEEGDYGLYVKTVNGITLDYDKDGKYWAFYVDGEYATAGVDATDIVEGISYEMKAE